MGRIYRTSDNINIKVDSIEVTISPLNMSQKAQLQGDMAKALEGEVVASMNAVSNALKFSIKDIKGLKTLDEDGNEVDYKPEFENGQLSDEAISDLFNMEETQKLNSICSSLIGGFNGKFLDPEGNPLEGVEVVSVKPGKK